MTTKLRPFETKGEVAEWKLVYDRLSRLGINETITYAEINEALDRDLDENRGPLYRADQQLQQRNHRALTNIRGIGYRVVEAREHEGLARKRQRRARQQVSKGLRVVKAADRSKLTSQEAARLDDLEARFSRLEGYLKDLAKKQKATDKRLSHTVERSEDLEEKVEKLTKALEKHGFEI